MAGLGKRGQEKIEGATPDALFRKTENTQSSIEVNTQNSISAKPDAHTDSRLTRKQYVFSYELSEKLRECAFRERRKEVDIVRSALMEYLAGREENIL